MTNFQPANQLQKHRSLMLACEAIGWLHMAGKAKMDFLRVQGCEKVEYDDRCWHKKESPPFPWNDLLAWIENRFFEIDGANIPGPIIFTEFLEKQRNNSGCGPLGLLLAGHGIASGIEKNIPGAPSDYLKQKKSHIWRSSAFGNPERNLVKYPPEILTDAGWKRLLEKIKSLLQELKKKGNPAAPDTPEVADLWKWREDAVGNKGWLRRDFSSTLAETRLPNNDVTLFDQSYVAAALFKSAMAGAVLEGGSFPWKDTNLKQEIRWRLCTVGISADYFEARAVKIGDWTGAGKTLDVFFTDVRKLLEVDLALGSLLYRDQSVLVFSFPGERTEEKNGVLKIGKWTDFLRGKIEDYAREQNLEIPPYLEISDNPSRSLVGMTREIRKAQNTMQVPLHRDWAVPGAPSGDGHVCPVCQVRRNDTPTSKQKPCPICRKRRTHRLESWFEIKEKSDSIWISEVADGNDRVALISMSLDLLPWLDGSKLDSCRSQAINEWGIKNSTEKTVLPSKYAELISWVKTALGSGNEASRIRSLIQRKIAPGLKDKDKHDVPWNKFYELIVEDRSDAPAWSDAEDKKDQQAAWLVHQLFCKLASPGRIYRFQRQTEEFFSSLLGRFREIASVEKNHWRTRRLLLKPDENKIDKRWHKNTPYAGRIGDIPVDLLWKDELKGFITISNLARVDAQETLSGKTIPLKSDENKEAGTFRIEKVCELPDAFGPMSTYNPVIPLQLSPLRFRVLVPLNTASECIDQAVSSWNEQFSRVWDRLPLRTGVVAFPRTTPFQSVIEALRNLEEDLTAEQKGEIFRLFECQPKDGCTELHFKSPDKESREFLQTTQHTLTDRQKDVFYPYFAVADKQISFPLDFRHPRGQVYRHVTDLRPGDDVNIQPSGIITLFLDSTGKRFERQPRYLVWRWAEMRKLWRVIKACAPSQTALQGAWAELTARREDWQNPEGNWLEGGLDAWKELASAVFYDRLGFHGTELEMLVQAAESGLMNWCLEWNLKVLKKQISGETVA